MDVFSELRVLRNIISNHIKKTSKEEYDIDGEYINVRSNEELYDKLESIEKNLLEFKNELFSVLKNISFSGSEKEPNINKIYDIKLEEAENIFIPNIRIDGSELRSKTEHSNILMDDSLASSIDILSELEMKHKVI